MTPRQLADSIVCAVLDAADDEAWDDRQMTPGERDIKRADAVLDAIREAGFHFETDDWNQILMMRASAATPPSCQ